MYEGKIKIIAQLIDSNDDHIWSKEYNENFDDIITVQNNVAQEVMKQLEITLSPQEEITLKKYPTDNMEAYILYLKGQKLGYQDAGAWTFFKSTRLERRKAAWLYAQFTVSKTVSLKKTLVGLTPIRNSDLNSQDMGAVSKRLGGFLEFYRSPARVLWTPTGMNVPDYPKLARLWWQNVGLAVDGTVSVELAMANLAREMDRVLARLERIGMEKCAPELNPPQEKSIWLDRTGSPKPALLNEDPPGRTISYEKLLQTWQQ